MPEPPSPKVAQTETATAALQSKSGSPTTVESDPPVNMERLHDFTSGNADDLRELINLYLKQTGEQITQLIAAVKAGSAPEVRRLAHSCAGASATCGMGGIVPLLQELEREGDQGKLTNAVELSQRVEKEFNRISDYLEAYLAGQPHLAIRS
jgi:HPt (histidine-containing phosphotransfer) domain-containing protein